MIRTTERMETEILLTLDVGAAIIRKTQRMRHLNLLVFVEAIFEPPLTVHVLN